MAQIINGFGQFLPYVFMLVVLGLVWHIVISAFGGHL